MPSFFGAAGKNDANPAGFWQFQVKGCSPHLPAWNLLKLVPGHMVPKLLEVHHLAVIAVARFVGLESADDSISDSEAFRDEIIIGKPAIKQKKARANAGFFGPSKHLLQKIRFFSKLS